MKLLTTQEDFDKWKKEHISSGDTVEQPREFPCYVRTEVKSWNYEEERAIYLYRDDLEKMIEGMAPNQELTGGGLDAEQRRRVE